MFLGTAQPDIYVSSNGAHFALLVLALAHVSCRFAAAWSVCCCPGYVSLPWCSFCTCMCSSGGTAGGIKLQNQGS
jgi:hypothetical protein